MNSSLISKILAITLLVLIAESQTPSQQPVIGIYTQDAQDFQPWTSESTSHSSSSSSSNSNPNLKQKTKTYIASSYVKNLQMAGAQVIPLFYHYSYAQLQDILSKINGVYFPGGQMSIRDDVNWTNKTRFIFNYAKKQNDNGNNYPLWGTCLGYYTLMFACSGETDVYKMLTEVTGEHGVVHPLILYRNDSRMLGSFTREELKDATEGNGIFYFSHRWSILLTTFNNYPAWRQLFNVIATSKTSYGLQFMSILEGKKYPFFLTQFHSEKNSFEWRSAAVRTYNAISAEQKLMNYFINEARKNRNQFPWNELEKKLIYNYQPTLLALEEYFVQVYLFDESDL